MPLLEDEFGDIVRKARVGRGLSIEQVAAETGIDARKIADFEAYRSRPDKGDCDSLARTLGLGTSALWEAAEEAYVPMDVEIPADLEIVRFVFDGMNSNGYLVHVKAAPATFIVDPGGDPAEMLATLAERDWSLSAILLTHGHSDHIEGLERVRTRHDVPVYADAREWRGTGLRDIAGQSSLDVDGARVGILSSPGHTRAGVVFTWNGAAAVGDTLFAGSLGGALGGPEYFERLLASARAIVSLPPETVLLPGHGPLTTVREQLAHNPFLAVGA